MGRGKRRFDVGSIAVKSVLLRPETGDANDLIKRARGCLRYAYVPYSGFAVGAVVVDQVGRFFTGANIENASYGLTICAERVAIFAAIAAGAKTIQSVTVTSAKSRPISPCGACRQVMLEFCLPNALFFSDAGRGRIVSCLVHDLLPNAFVGRSLTQSQDIEVLSL